MRSLLHQKLGIKQNATKNRPAPGFPEALHSSRGFLLRSTFTPEGCLLSIWEGRKLPFITSLRLMLLHAKAEAHLLHHKMLYFALLGGLILNFSQLGEMLSKGDCSLCPCAWLIKAGHNKPELLFLSAALRRHDFCNIRLYVTWTPPLRVKKKRRSR